MKLYIASHSQEMAKSLMERLTAQGHEITSRWITEDTKFHRGTRAYTSAERRALCMMDEEDIRRCDALVLLAEAAGRNVPGGKHVETGIAIALGQPVFVLGRRENIFHWHPCVRVFEDFASLLFHLQRF